MDDPYHPFAVSLYPNTESDPGSVPDPHLAPILEEDPYDRERRLSVVLETLVSGGGEEEEEEEEVGNEVNVRKKSEREKGDIGKIGEKREIREEGRKNSSHGGSDTNRAKSPSMMHNADSYPFVQSMGQSHHPFQTAPLSLQIPTPHPTPHLSQLPTQPDTPHPTQYPTSQSGKTLSAFSFPSPSTRPHSSSSSSSSSISSQSHSHSHNGIVQSGRESSDAIAGVKETEGSERGKIRVSADGMGEGEGEGEGEGQGEGEGEGKDHTSALHDDIAMLGDTR
jgi:hypothetical protein